MASTNISILHGQGQTLRSARGGDPTRLCTKLNYLAMHEAGHAFGLSHPTQDDSISVMNYRHLTCYPENLDIVAIKAIYQSRSSSSNEATATTVPTTTPTSTASSATANTVAATATTSGNQPATVWQIETLPSSHQPRHTHNRIRVFQREYLHLCRTDLHDKRDQGLQPRCPYPSHSRPRGPRAPRRDAAPLLADRHPRQRPDPPPLRRERTSRRPPMGHHLATRPAPGQCPPEHNMEYRSDHPRRYRVIAAMDGCPILVGCPCAWEPVRDRLITPCWNKEEER